MQKKALLVAVVAVLSACGGGKPVVPVEETPGGVIVVRASAGSPLEGVKAVAYAIDPVTGKPVETRAEGAVLAEATGANAAGELELKLGETVAWNGPVQVVVTGDAIQYVDPTGEGNETLVSLPDSFRLTSFVPEYRSGSSVTVPVTLWTSLADAAVLAYAEGRTADSSAAVPVERAFPVIDDLFAKHLSRPQAWDLRKIVPVDGRENVGSVRDVVFAALADIALNQLARDISVTAGHQPGAVITAYQLLELLRADVSDGLFNGFEGDNPLAARGGVYELSSRTTRFDLARALGAFVDAPANATGLTRQSLESYSVFDNIALDRNFLYPADEDPEAFDAVPPEVSLLEALPEYVAEQGLTVRVSADDNSVGVAHVRALVQNAAGAKPFTAERVDDHWVFALDLVVGANSIRIWAEDEAVPANSGEGWDPPHSILGTVVVDVTAPTLGPVSRNSHKNEDGAPLAFDGSTLRVPGELNLEGRGYVDIGAQTPALIKKTYVTSTWGEREPTDEDFARELDLEGDNPLNLPFRQFDVDFAGGDAEAPIEPLRWRFEASDDGGDTWHASEGTALEAAERDEGKLFFNVVFSRETIPLLATTRAREVKLKLFLTVADAAGNTRAGEFANTYVFVDTPLHYKVDAAYPRQESSKSLYAYFADTTKYDDIFLPGSVFDREGAVRVGRVEVFNPWPVPVAVSQSSNSNFRFSEEWMSDTETRFSGVGMDGFTFKSIELFPAARTSTRPLDGLSCLHAYAYPCGVGNWLNSRHIRHDYGSAQRLTCGSGATPPLSAFTLEMRLLHPNARYVLTENSVADVYAQRVGGEGGAAVVPPASQSEAGRIVVFPGLPSAPFTARAWNAVWKTVQIGGQAKSRFVENAGIVYKALTTTSTSCEGINGPESGLIRHEARQWRRTLLSAASRYSAGGTLEFRARPVYTGGSTPVEVGPVQTQVPVPFSVSFTHASSQ